MERSGNCNCGTGKVCKVHDSCPQRCKDCDCGCNSAHPCNDCGTCSHPYAQPE
ncbi:MAG: hypothetical protein AB7F19_03295 [Candidatus Babeliales bacterium]